MASWLVARWHIGGELAGGETSWWRDDRIPFGRSWGGLVRVTFGLLNQIYSLQIGILYPVNIPFIEKLCNPLDSDLINRQSLSSLPEQVQGGGGVIWQCF